MGGGAVCIIREDLNRVVERLKAKNATRTFGGECDYVGDANLPGCYTSILSSKQSYWCGQSSRFWFCSHVTTCVCNNSSGAYRVLSDLRLFIRTGINGQRVVVGGHLEVRRGGVFVVV